MKKVSVFCLFIMLTFGTMAVFAQSRLAGMNDPSRPVSSGQSEIIINAENAERDIAVWVNGTIVAHVWPKTRERIIVYNGQNVVEVAETTLGRSGQWNIGTKKRIVVNSVSNTVIIGMTLRYGAIVSLSEQNFSLGGAPIVGAPPQPAARAPVPAARKPAQQTKSASGIEQAVYSAAGVLSERFLDGSTLAVLNIATNDSELTEFIIEELTFLLVDARRFKVVDRRSLDAVRAETRFQVTGEVDDNSAVSIGKMLGASIVITGSVSGSGSTRRLRAKALDVQTAEILGMASEPF